MNRALDKRKDRPSNQFSTPFMWTQRCINASSIWFTVAQVSVVAFASEILFNMSIFLLQQNTESHDLTKQESLILYCVSNQSMHHRDEKKGINSFRASQSGSQLMCLAALCTGTGPGDPMECNVGMGVFRKQVTKPSKQQATFPILRYYGLFRALEPFGCQ